MDSIVGEVLSRLFMFVLFGIAASIIQEAVAAFVSARSAYLELGIRALLGKCIFENGVSFIDRFYHHGFVQSLMFGRSINQSTKYQDWGRSVLGISSSGDLAGASNAFTLPSFIPSKVFAMVIVDILNTEKLDGASALPAIEKQILLLRESSQLQDIGIPGTSEALMAMLNDAAHDENVLERFHADLEQWFDRTMDSVTRSYQQYVQRSLILTGLFLAVIFNIDSTRVARVEWMEKDARQAIQKAQDTYFNNVLKSDPQFKLFSGEELTRLEKEAANVRYNVSFQYAPIGWRYTRQDYQHLLTHPDQWNPIAWLTQITGWLITAYAISLFASIWFDAMKRLRPLLSGTK